MFENKDNSFILRLDGFEEQRCIQVKISNRVLNVGVCTLGEGVCEAHQEMTKTTAGQRKEAHCYDLNMCVPRSLKFTRRILAPKVMVLGSEGFGRWLGHKGGTFLNGTSILIRDAIEIPSLLVRTQQGSVCCEPGRGLSLECDHAGNLTLDVPASGIVRSEFLFVLSHPICNISNKLKHTPRRCVRGLMDPRPGPGRGHACPSLSRLAWIPRPRFCHPGGHVGTCA